MSKPIDIKKSTQNFEHCAGSCGSSPSPSSNPSPITGNKVRCFICKKKLNLIEAEFGMCKCGNTFCPKHKSVQVSADSSSSHPCSWEYLKKSQELLEQRNSVIVNSKLEKI